jgi:pimeloyl-ACP methyl ester carboxylesterase
MDRSGLNPLRQIIFPGWAVPPKLYAGLQSFAVQSAIFDFGFFSPDREFRFEPPGDTENCFITGHSLGAAMALNTACHCPAVKALVLFSPFARFTSDKDYDAWPEEMLYSMIRQFDRKPRSVLKSFYRKMAYPGKFRISHFPTPNFRAMRMGLACLAEIDLRDILEKISIPTLIIQGEQDLITTPAMADFLKKHLSRVEVISVKNAGHCLTFEITPEHKSQISGFLRRSIK